MYRFCAWLCSCRATSQIVISMVFWEKANNSDIWTTNNMSMSREYNIATRYFLNCSSCSNQLVLDYIYFKLSPQISNYLTYTYMTCHDDPYYAKHKRKQILISISMHRSWNIFMSFTNNRYLLNITRIINITRISGFSVLSCFTLVMRTLTCI